MIRKPILLDPDPLSAFPPAGQALDDPEGLLAVGGDLDPARLLNAYRHGIFPWYSRGQPILWWSPDPRMVFDTDAFRLPSRFARSLRKSTWRLRADQAFDTVVAACAHAPRSGQRGTWILPEMARAYAELHRLGHAHSIEVVDDDEQLVGGLYGVAVGRAFFGESMFSAVPGGSKVALAGLLRLLAGWGWPLMDAQMENPHLLLLGGERMPRERFLRRVAELTALPGRPGSWRDELRDWPASALARPPAAAGFCAGSPPVA